MTSADESRGGGHLVVAGFGMVGHRFVERLVELDTSEFWSVTVIGEEARPAYDRVRLSSWFEHRNPDQLALTPLPIRPGITVRTGRRVTSIARTAQKVTLDDGSSVGYDRLVLATGSTPFVPPLPGTERAGVFVYRTLDDLEAIARWCEQPTVRTGAVLGGGLLGLEAAHALREIGIDTHVVERAPQLMSAQLDTGGGAALRARVEDLGLSVHTGVSPIALDGDGTSGPVRRLVYDIDADTPGRRDALDVDIVVVSAGIRPRDELGRDAGLALGARGGVVVDDTLTTSDPRVHAIGEVACHRDRVYGLVAPGYRMADTLAERLTGQDTTFIGARLDTKLKLLGVDVVCFGDPIEDRSDVTSLVWQDGPRRVYRRLVVNASTGMVQGGVLVGDATGHATLAAMSRGEIPSPADPSPLIVPVINGRQPDGIAALADSAVVCSCENVTRTAIDAAIDQGAQDADAVKAACRAGAGCGGCVPVITDLIRERLEATGMEVDRSLCEHFAYTRRELFDLIVIHGYSSWSEVLQAHGNGRGCAVCRPTVASILASRQQGHVLDGDQAAIQDSNDHVLANIQRDGTYSVVPRVPGGEITPEQLIALGEIARDFHLSPKITGGQRVDLLGARLEHLPAIWERVVAAGMESGHAYGKAVRTVKSCVGSTWCRYGVQDSTSMAIALELRYRGLRAPHKIKLAVSGCARECAEAQSKDVGVIATERGWNLYVGGNGGKTPRHADLLATDLDDSTLVRTIDRFLMYYVRTADRLERTSVWLSKLDGGVDYVRRVVLDDALGLAAELEADMQRHIESYECEWRAVLGDPVRRSRFESYVNAPGTPDPEIVHVFERGVVRPASASERHAVTQRLIDPVPVPDPRRRAPQRVTTGAGS